MDAASDLPPAESPQTSYDQTQQDRTNPNDDKLQSGAAELGMDVGHLIWWQMDSKAQKDRSTNRAHGRQQDHSFTFLRLLVPTTRSFRSATPATRSRKATAYLGIRDFPTIHFDTVFGLTLNRPARMVCVQPSLFSLSRTSSEVINHQLVDVSARHILRFGDESARYLVEIVRK